MENRAKADALGMLLDFINGNIVDRVNLHKAFDERAVNRKEFDPYEESGRDWRDDERT